MFYNEYMLENAKEYQKQVIEEIEWLRRLRNMRITARLAKKKCCQEVALEKSSAVASLRSDDAAESRNKSTIPA
jgi:hypothetical protein